MPERSRSAWWASSLLHAAAVVAVALSWPKPAPPVAEIRREIGITIAQHHRLGETEYFDNEADVQPSSNVSHFGASAALPAEDAQIRRNIARAMPDDADGLGVALADTVGLLSQVGAGAAQQPRQVGLDGEDDIVAADPVRNRKTGPKIPPARLAVFGQEAVGRSFVFVLDRSQSMGGAGSGALYDAEDELLRALEPLETIHQFQIIAYNDELKYLHRPGMAQATDQQKTRAEKFLRGLTPVRGTEHETAILAALRQGPEVIFLLTDGDEPPLHPNQIREITVRAGRTTAIHVIHFGSGPPNEKDHFLARLARLNRGEYRYVDVSL